MRNVDVKHLKWTDDKGPHFQIAIPSVEDVEEIYHPPPAEFYKGGDPNKDIIAIATAVYQGMIPSAVNSWSRMILQAAWDFGPGNVWVIPARERLSYPYAPLYALASLFKTEDLAGKRADWFAWFDDDVVYPSNILSKLRVAADPEERPFLAAVGNDRYPPFWPAVWVPKDNGEGLYWHEQWEEPPESGVHKVQTTGLCAALFHRSFFDRVPQPWFSSMPPIVNDKGGIDSKVNPDSWLCQQCAEAGVPIHVTCDVDITHQGLSMPINRQTAPMLRKVFGKAGEK